MNDFSELYQELLTLAHHPMPAPPQNDQIQNGVTVLHGLFEDGQLVSIKETPFTDDIFLHCHDNIEISYLLSGSVQMTIEAQTITMAPGSFLVLDTNCVHCPHLMSEDTLLLSINVRTSFFDEAFFKRFYRKDDITNFFAKSIYTGKNDHRYLYYACDSARIRESVGNMVSEFYHPTVCSQELVEAYMMIFFAEMIRLRTTSPQYTVYSEKPGAASLPQFSAIIDYMNRHLEHVTRSDVADYFGYSYSHVNSIIRSATGSGFIQLRQTLRLQRLEKLLTTTDLCIAEAADMAGFHNLSDCYKLFREAYHMSLQEYRETYSVDALK